MGTRENEGETWGNQKAPNAPSSDDHKMSVMMGTRENEGETWGIGKAPKLQMLQHVP